jgi:hypothetical protein
MKKSEPLSISFTHLYASGKSPQRVFYTAPPEKTVDPDFILKVPGLKVDLQPSQRCNTVSGGCTHEQSHPVHLIYDLVQAGCLVKWDGSPVRQSVPQMDTRTFNEIFQELYERIPGEQCVEADYVGLRLKGSDPNRDPKTLPVLTVACDLGLDISSSSQPDRGGSGTKKRTGEDLPQWFVLAGPQGSCISSLPLMVCFPEPVHYAEMRSQALVGAPSAGLELKKRSKEEKLHLEIQSAVLALTKAQQLLLQFSIPRESVIPFFMEVIKLKLDAAVGVPDRKAIISSFFNEHMIERTKSGVENQADFHISVEGETPVASPMSIPSGTGDPDADLADDLRLFDNYPSYSNDYVALLDELETRKFGDALDEPLLVRYMKLERAARVVVAKGLQLSLAWPDTIESLGKRLEAAMAILTSNGSPSIVSEGLASKKVSVVWKKKDGMEFKNAKTEIVQILFALFKACGGVVDQLLPQAVEICTKLRYTLCDLFVAMKIQPYEFKDPANTSPSFQIFIRRLVELVYSITLSKTPSHVEWAQAFVTFRWRGEPHTTPEAEGGVTWWASRGVWVAMLFRMFLPLDIERKMGKAPLAELGKQMIDKLSSVKKETLATFFYNEAASVAKSGKALLVGAPRIGLENRTEKKSGGGGGVPEETPSPLWSWMSLYTGGTTPQEMVAAGGQCPGKCFSDRAFLRDMIKSPQDLQEIADIKDMTGVSDRPAFRDLILRVKEVMDPNGELTKLLRKQNLSNPAVRPLIHYPSPPSEPWPTFGREVGCVLVSVYNRGGVLCIKKDGDKTPSEFKATLALSFRSGIKFYGVLRYASMKMDTFASSASREIETMVRGADLLRLDVAIGSTAEREPESLTLMTYSHMDKQLEFATHKLKLHRDSGALELAVEHSEELGSRRFGVAIKTPAWSSGSVLDMNLGPEEGGAGKRGWILVHTCGEVIFGSLDQKSALITRKMKLKRPEVTWSDQSAPSLILAKFMPKSSRLLTVWKWDSLGEWSVVLYDLDAKLSSEESTVGSFEFSGLSEYEIQVKRPSKIINTAKFSTPEELQACLTILKRVHTESDASDSEGFRRIHLGYLPRVIFTEGTETPRSEVEAMMTCYCPETGRTLCVTETGVTVPLERSNTINC